MADVNNLVALIKQIALETFESHKPTQLVFGTVTSVEPIEVLVEQKLTLTSAQLVVSKHCLLEDYTIELDGCSPTTPDQSIALAGSSISVDNVNYSIEGHTVNVSGHTIEVEGHTFDIYGYMLEVGDTIALLRQQGGQKYLILDKVVGL